MTIKQCRFEEWRMMRTWKKQSPGLTRLIILISLGIGLLVSALAGCSNSGVEKIPITTSSDQARQFFVPGRELNEKLRPLEAGHYYREAITLDSNFALAYLYLAATDLRSDEKLRHLEKAMSLADRVSEGERLMIKAEWARIRGERDSEGDCYRRLVTLYPQDERARALLGRYYWYMKEYAKSAVEYKKVVEINPDYAPAYNMIGYTSSYLGNYEDAKKAFMRYIELIPSDPNPYDSYAELMLRMGRFSESLLYYEKALKKNPYFFVAYGGVASALNCMGQHAEARMQLRTLLERARNVDHQRLAYFGMAVSFADEGNLDSALAYLNKSFRLARQADNIPAMAEDLNRMGRVLLADNRPDEAMKKYRRAAKLYRESSLSDVLKSSGEQYFLYNSAMVAVHENDPETARERATQYLAATESRNDPKLVMMYYELAVMIALAEGNFTDALTEFRQTDLQNPFNIRRLAEAHAGLGESAEAEKLIDRASTLYIDNDLNQALYRGTITTIRLADNDK